jgi:hypothetical protein
MRDLRRERACARKELAGFVELGPCLGLGFGGLPAYPGRREWPPTTDSDATEVLGPMSLCVVVSLFLHPHTTSEIRPPWSRASRRERLRSRRAVGLPERWRTV